MTLHIPLEIWQKLRTYTELCAPNEVTGIGTVVVLDSENLMVTETFLPRQTTSPAECEFKDGELNEIICDLLEQSPERAAELRFRWHSHGQSKVFWSGKDEADIDSWESPWVVNLVTNVHGEFLVRLDYFSPLRIRNYPMELRIDVPEGSEALYAACAEELKTKLSFMNALAQTLRKEP